MASDPPSGRFIGRILASHWPEPLPEYVWCNVHKGYRLVTGFSAYEEEVAGLYLQCGHREDPPWTIRANP